jgi:hypothetical protein
MGLSFTIPAGPRQSRNFRVRVTRDSWPYFTVSDSKLPQPVGSGVHIYIAQEQGVPVIPLGTGFPFHRLPQVSRRATVEVFDPASTWDVAVEVFLSLSLESYITTDGQSASLSWYKALIWGIRPDFYYCQTAAGLLMWGALSDETTNLSFTISAGTRQRSHPRVRVPWNSRPYFTVSDSRLPFLSPPTTRWATVEVFDVASTRNILLITPLHGPSSKHRFQQYLYCYMRVHWSKNVLTVPLLWYTCLSRGRCIVTALRAAIIYQHDYTYFSTARELW